MAQNHRRRNLAPTAQRTRQEAKGRNTFRAAVHLAVGSLPGHADRKITNRPDRLTNVEPVCTLADGVARKS